MLRQHIDIFHCKVGTGFVSHGKQMQHGVGAAAHGNVESHGIEHCLTCGNASRQYRFIALIVVTMAVVDDNLCRFLEQLAAVGVSGKYGAVAGKCQAYGLVEAVH